MNEIQKYNTQSIEHCVQYFTVGMTINAIFSTIYNDIVFTCDKLYL